jgi:hypothetical protein
MTRFVRGRVSKTSLPDYAEEARERKIQSKKNAYQSEVQFRLSGYQGGKDTPENYKKYEDRIKKNLLRYYVTQSAIPPLDNEYYTKNSLDYLENKAVAKVLELHPVPTEPRYYYNPKTHKRDILAPPYVNANGKPFKPFITKNGKRFRVR